MEERQNPWAPYRLCDAAGLEGDEEEHEAGLNDDEDLPGCLEVLEGRPHAHTIRHQVQLQAQCYHLRGETVQYIAVELYTHGQREITLIFIYIDIFW